jgi:Plasma-membrane choline transporter
MDSIFFNTTASSMSNGPAKPQYQQQQQDQLTEKLLVNDSNVSSSSNNPYPHHDLLLQEQTSFPYSQQQQQQQQQQSQQQSDMYTGVNTSATSSSNSVNDGDFFQPSIGVPRPSNQNHYSNSSGTGEKQAPQYRDVWAAIAFLACQGIVLYMALIRGISNVWYHKKQQQQQQSREGYIDGTEPYVPIDPTTEDASMRGVVYIILLSTLSAFLVTTGMLFLLMKYAHIFLQITIGLVVLGNALVVLFCFVYHMWYGLLAAVGFLIFSILCARSYQRRLPFAAANLNVALSAITTNYGLFFIAFGVSILVNFIYSIITVLAHFGAYSKHQIDMDDERTSAFVAIFLIGMYYWTIEVGKNIIHVSTAGVVGTYWFAPEDASTFWSPAIYDSFYRSVTYSFGSICFGSLITTLLQILNHWIREAKRMHRRTIIGPSVILCMLECISGFLERIVTYFNKWAYVYVGLYGYDYLTAGSKVITLFADRGWTTIINDHLVSSVLSLVSVMIGVGAGCVGLLLAIAHR